MPRMTTLAAPALLALGACATSLPEAPPPLHDERGVVSATHPDSGGPPPEASETLITRLHDVEGRLKLAAVLEAAAARNPRVRAAGARVDAAGHRRAQVVVPPDPRVTLGWYAEPVETRTGPQHFALGLSQGIPWPEKLAVAGDLADIGRDMARIAAWSTTRDVLVEATGSFHELAYLHGALEATGLIEEALKRLVALAARGEEPGRTRLPEVVRSETWLAQVQYDAVMLRELLAAEEEHLRALLALPGDVKLGVPEEVAVPPLAVKPADLLPFATRHNQEIQEARLEVERSRRRAEQAALRSLPDFSVGARYLVTGRRTGGVDLAGEGRDPFIFELGMTLPVFASSNRAAVEEARSQWRAAVQDRQAEVERVRTDLARAYWRAANAERLHALYRDTLLPQAERAAQAAEALFAEGEAALSGVIETVAAWHHFQLGALRARADHAQGLAELERLLGAPLAPVAEGRTGEEEER